MATPSQQDIDNAKALFNCRSNGLQEKEITFAQGQVLSGLSLLDNQQVDQALDFFSCRANGAQQKEISFYIGVLLANLDISTGSGITQLTGDVTAGPGSGSVVATLAAVRIGGDVSAALAGSVLVSTGSGNNAMATGVTIDGSENISGVNMLGIGKTPTTALDILYSGSGAAARIENSSVSGFSQLSLYNNSGVEVGGFGYANGSASFVPGQSFFYSVGKNFNFSLDGGSTVALFLETSSNNVGIGTSTPSSRLEVNYSDSSTSTIVNALTLTHATSATAAANLGVALASVLPSDSGALRNAGQFVTAWDTPTNGSETSRLELHSLNVGVDFIAASFSPSLTLLAGGSLSIPSIGDDGQTHLQTGSFVATIGGATRRILTADP